MQKHIAVIGAGPAGLTAAYLLTKEQIPVTVLEADPTYVGGIARTVTYKGYCFDIGGHRFFSKSKEIEALWTEMLPNDLLERPRSSRIYYRGKFFSYPLKAFEALFKLGLKESVLCFCSYVKAKIAPIKPPKSFADWVTNHFGNRLFTIFFKTYTEKVWGMACSDISADWAAQRIKNLSLWSAIVTSLLPKKCLLKKTGQPQQTIKTLIDHFRYPRKGPGMLWEACAHHIKKNGGHIALGCRVISCQYHAARAIWQINYYDDTHQEVKTIHATHLISSAPLQELVQHYLVDIPNDWRNLAKRLRYRDFLIVVLILNDKKIFSDNWIYVHDDQVEVARIQNFKSWSPEMVPHPDTCCYGLEYFCFKEDSTWTAPDHELIKKASEELVQLGLAQPEDILDGCVVRQAKAYPVYDRDYQHHVDAIRKALDSAYPTLYLVGRNGMHKYNNQDHAMMTGMLTVKNILLNQLFYDVWRVNQDAEYIESGSRGDERIQDARACPKHLST